MSWMVTPPSTLVTAVSSMSSGWAASYAKIDSGAGDDLGAWAVESPGDPVAASTPDAQPAMQTMRLRATRSGPDCEAIEKRLCAGMTCLQRHAFPITPPDDPVGASTAAASAPV